MALETGIQSAQPNELRREYHQWMDGTAVAASGAMNGFITGNKTGAILMVKATSAGGTPQYMLSLQTAYEDVDATYTDVIAISRPDLIVINDESWHVWTVNLTNAMQYARFYITLSGADAGDDKFYFHSCFLYGDFTQAIDVSLESPVVSIGSVKLEDGTTATNKADVNDADTARAPDTKVIATQNIDAAGLVHNLGTGVMAASAPVTIATDDTMIAALDAAVDLIQADTTAMNAKMAALGTAAMVASSPVTIATDDTMITALDAAMDIVAGDTTSLDAKITACNTGAVVGSVKLEDGTTAANKADISDADTARTTATHVIATQPIDAAGAVLSTSALATSANQLADGHGVAVADGADVTQGAKADAKDSATDATAISIMQVLKQISFSTQANSGNTEIMDDWDESDRCKSNPIAGQAGVAANRGVADALTQRVAQARDLTVTNATGSGAIATTTAVSANWKLDHITIHLSAAPTTSQDLDISIDANDGAAYDTILLSQDLSASSATDIVYKNPVGDLILESGDEIKVAYTNTDGLTYGLRVVGEKI